MPSKFGWIDFAEEDRQKMLDIVQLFRERDTRDELGIGTIRDTFADHFFPGTSTIQTRVKYMLFVPWIYTRLERKRVPSSSIQHRARNDEIKLIFALLENGESDGVIGIEAKKELQRLPSSIYWNGLASWGIRLFPGSQDQYHRYLDTHYHLEKPASREETDDESFDSVGRPNWHPGIPKGPEDQFEAPTLKLTLEQAQYLRERVLIHHSNSLLSALLNKGQIVNVDFPWEHPVARSLPSSLADDLQHARNFSEVMHGSSLLYNYLLAEEVESEKLKADYEDRLTKWTKMLSDRQGELQDWYAHIGAFWKSGALERGRIPFQTRSFVNRWLRFLFEAPGPERVARNGAVRTEIVNREVQLKKSRARLGNRRALELWRGESGTAQLSFRWATASRFTADIIQGLD